MNQNNALKRVYLKIGLLFGIFVFILVVYFYLFKFYSQKLMTKITELNSLKEKIAQNQESLEKENRSKKIVTSIQEKSNKELQEILFKLQQKLTRNFETIKNLVSEKIQKENWQIKTTNFNQQENKLNFVFQINNYDFDNFYNFMVDSGLFWQTTDLKINKGDNLWEIDLTLQAK